MSNVDYVVQNLDSNVKVVTLEELIIHLRNNFGTPVPPPQTPYLEAPQTIPGTVQAEYFDSGGEGVGYHDSDSANLGGQLRPGEGVDIEVCADAGGGWNVGWIAAGEWVEYTVNVSANGDYDFKVRVASESAGGEFHIEMNGRNVTGPQSFTATGGWQNWTTVEVPGITLFAGDNQVVRVAMDGAGWNLNHIEITPHIDPPGKATNPNPPHLATGVRTNADLTWTAAAGATSYNVYFGTSDLPSFRDNVPGTVFDPGAMAPQTDHFWRIDAVNDGGTTPGDVWTFTTGSGPGDFDGDGDVDQEDFGCFQECLTGSGVPQTDPDCQDARLDHDEDVDQDDFGIFQACTSGPNVPPAPGCAG